MRTTFAVLLTGIIGKKGGNFSPLHVGEVSSYGERLASFGVRTGKPHPEYPEQMEYDYLELPNSSVFVRTLEEADHIDTISVSSIFEIWTYQVGNITVISPMWLEGLEFDVCISACKAADTPETAAAIIEEMTKEHQQYLYDQGVQRLENNPTVQEAKRAIEGIELSIKILAENQTDANAAATADLESAKVEHEATIKHWMKIELGSLTRQRAFDADATGQDEDDFYNIH